MDLNKPDEEAVDEVDAPDSTKGKQGDAPTFEELDRCVNSVQEDVCFDDANFIVICLQWESSPRLALSTSQIAW